MFWRREAAELNYRRFFAVTTLAGIRVEVPWVFEETHAEIAPLGARRDSSTACGSTTPTACWTRAGTSTRLRAQRDRTARTCSSRRSSSTAKPARVWETDGTTGYDALADIDRVLVDPAGEATLDAARRAPARRAPCRRLARAHPRHEADDRRHRSCARRCAARALACRPTPVGRIAADALAELLACFPVYRSYLPAGASTSTQAAAEASARRPDLADAIARARARRSRTRASGRAASSRPPAWSWPRASRTPPSTATRGSARSPRSAATRRSSRSTSTSSTGARQRARPRGRASMTTLSTHDTKRGEDVRARLDVLAELPERWARRARRPARVARPPGTARSTTCCGRRSSARGPHRAERLHAYAEKAAREAGEATELVATRTRRSRRGCTRPSTRCSTTRRVRRAARRVRRRDRSRRLDATRSPRSCCSSRRPACPTSTRAASCGSTRSSTPTTAARSTSTSAGGCSPSSTRARTRRAAACRRVGRGQAAGHLPCAAAAPRPPRAVHPLHADDRASATAADHVDRVRPRRRAHRRDAAARRARGARRLGRHRARCGTPATVDDALDRSRLRGLERSASPTCSATYPVALLVPAQRSGRA